MPDASNNDIASQRTSNLFVEWQNTLKSHKQHEHKHSETFSQKVISIFSLNASYSLIYTKLGLAGIDWILRARSVLAIRDYGSLNSHWNGMCRAHSSTLHCDTLDRETHTQKTEQNKSYYELGKGLYLLIPCRKLNVILDLFIHQWKFNIHKVANDYGLYMFNVQLHSGIAYKY